MMTLLLIHLMLMPVGLAFLFLIWPNRPAPKIGVFEDETGTFCIYRASDRWMIYQLTMLPK